MQNDEYILNLNYLLERFLVFGKVFDECSRTTKLIARGQGYASENLPNLKVYYEKNIKAFQSFCQRANKIEAPHFYQQFHQDFTCALVGYLRATEKMTLAIDCGRNRLDEISFQRGLKDQATEKAALNCALQNVNKVSFD